MPTILIVGGGFCGVALTHGLARQSWPDGVRIVVAEKSGRFGRGAAYSTTHPAHLLNVPAGRMGALASDESHFLQWLRQNGAAIAGDAFVARSRYGDYLEHLFNDARANAGPGVIIEARQDGVISLENGAGSLRAKFKNGEELLVDRVVLAVGNLPPRDVEGFSSLATDPLYVRDPWSPGALDPVAGAQSVLLVGTGLTMVDTVLALHAGRGDANFIAVSRRGLLPQSHRDQTTRPAIPDPARRLDTWNGSASELLHIIREEARAAVEAGMDWRDVINALRPVTQVLWQRMPARERARFYRHARPFWDTHRHRMSTRVAARIEALMAHNQLSIVAGKIAKCARDGVRVAVDVRRRDGADARHVVDAVVNCTGPCSDLARVDDLLLKSLLSRGMIVGDALGIGIETGPEGAVIDGHGRESDVLFTLGGTRRPALWESTAVPELRVQADRLARRLHGSLNGVR